VTHIVRTEAFRQPPQVVVADDGAQLCVWSAGDDDGPLVLLLHGFSLDHSTWVPLAQDLVARGYRVVAPDLRGHGASTVGTSEPSLDQLVADIGAIMRQLDLSAVHLVGHSFGAVIALVVRVSGLADSIVSVTSLAGTEQALQNPIMKLGARLFSSRAGIWALGTQRLGRLIISTWFGKKPKTEHLDWIRQLSASCPPATRTFVTVASATLDLRPSFSLDGPPTLVMCGRDDKATLPKFSERIASAIKHSELAMLENCGHMAMIEKPSEVAERLNAWFTERQLLRPQGT